MVAQAALTPSEVLRPVGADLSRTHATPQFKLGTVARLSEGGEATYCISSGSIAQYALVAIDENFTARGCTTTLALLASGPGWPQIAFATDQYGWIHTKGTNILGKMRDATAADAALTTCASVGIMLTAASAGSHVLIVGTRNIALSSGAGAAYEILAINPSFKQVGAI